MRGVAVADAAEAVVGAVGQLQGFFIAAEGLQRQHRSEDLVLHDLVVLPDVGDRQAEGGAPSVQHQLPDLVAEEGPGLLLPLQLAGLGPSRAAFRSLRSSCVTDLRAT